MVFIDRWSSQTGGRYSEVVVIFFQLGLLHARAAASADSLNHLQQHQQVVVMNDRESSEQQTLDSADQLLAPIPITSARY